MNAEGVGPAITAEWVSALVTGLPILLLAYWLLRIQGALWRSLVWREASTALRELAGALSGSVQPTWMGWRVVAQGVSVDLRGGLRGPHTRLSVAGRTGVVRAARDGLLSAPEAMALLDEARRIHQEREP